MPSIPGLEISSSIAASMRQQQQAKKPKKPAHDKGGKGAYSAPQIGGTSHANDQAGQLVKAAPDQIVDAATMEQYGGRIRGTNDAAAGQSLASLSQRMGGTTASPLFNLLAGGIRGGAAANTAGQMLDLKLNALRENAAQANTKAGLGLDLAGQRQQGSMTLADLAQRGQQFEAAQAQQGQQFNASLAAQTGQQAAQNRLQQLQMGLSLNPNDSSGMAAGVASELGTPYPQRSRLDRYSTGSRGTGAVRTASRRSWADAL